jgi:hypothetical protein
MHIKVVKEYCLHLLSLTTSMDDNFLDKTLRKQLAESLKLSASYHMTPLVNCFSLTSPFSRYT